MKNQKGTIKEIFACNDIVSNEELFPLQKWYNELINKTEDEITTADVLRMLRQKKFVELAVSKAIDFLQRDIFEGELFDGELLETIVAYDKPFLRPYSNILRDILMNGLEENELHEWLDDEERKDFEAVIKSGLKHLEMAD